jgi:hypothetical protein
MSSKSRLPIDTADTDAMRNFLDAIDRRQLRVGQMEDLDSGAALSDVITAINAILATHRTK